MVILEVWGNKFPRVDKIWAKGRHCPPCPPPNDATDQQANLLPMPKPTFCQFP